MPKVLGYLWAAAGSYVLALLLCVVLQPGAVLSHDGLSFYGNFHRTFVPYGLGLGATAYFLIRACQGFQGTEAARNFRRGLEAIAIGLLGIVVTPSFSPVQLIQDLHVLFGLAIFFAQAILSVRYLIRAQRGLIDWILLGLQLVGIGGVVLSFRRIDVLRLMLPAQTLASMAFGALLIRAVGLHSHQAGAHLKSL